mgnify:CR=1 FL=1
MAEYWRLGVVWRQHNEWPTALFVASTWSLLRIVFEHYSVCLRWCDRVVVAVMGMDGDCDGDRVIVHSHRYRYYHRSLNPKKLIDVGFSHLAPRMTMARTIKLYKLPDVRFVRARENGSNEAQHSRSTLRYAVLLLMMVWLLILQHPQVPGIRPLAAADVAETCALLAQALAKYKIAPHFSEADFAHWFLPRAGVIQSYVVQVSCGAHILARALSLSLSRDSWNAPIWLMAHSVMRV